MTLLSSSSPTGFTASQAADDDVEDRDDAADDCVEDCSDSRDDGRESSTDCAEDVFDLFD